MNRAPAHLMRIRELSLNVRLGCSCEERAVPQEVRVSIELRFSEPPPGCTSDALSDTICYARISEAISEHAKEREFHLVEKMANDFYDILKSIVEERASISLAVHKVRPPVERLEGGVEYQVGDFT
jgi:FolB domain-containing protein